MEYIIPNSKVEYPEVEDEIIGSCREKAGDLNDMEDDRVRRTRLSARRRKS